MNRNQPPAQTFAANQLCGYCHQKPRFSNHAYCSKTCATQAATLCNHCHKKQKFQNFDYCGKNCASLANPGGNVNANFNPVAGANPNANVATGKARAGPSNNNQNRGPGNANANGYAKQQQQAQQPLAFDPIQIAKLVVQQMPQVQALLNAGNPLQTNGNTNANGPSAQFAASQAHAHAQSQYQQQQQPFGANNPFLNPGSHVNHNSNGSGNGGFGGSKQPSDNLECLIPGCGKPVHVDAKGLKTSDYCSQRHREDAVATGLAPACIMCLTRPQSHTDYFCSRSCREESLSKHYEASMNVALEEGDDDATLVNGQQGGGVIGAGVYSGGNLTYGISNNGIPGYGATGSYAAMGQEEEDEEDEAQVVRPPVKGASVLMGNSVGLTGKGAANASQ
ncbi:hypothetical protein FA15DRAFT_701862 [Coprinopsis marcescibilis]|uniref:Uncharacterized protein n=1 Tax=Coprinopsis marcescibilis TaxID=230819 RepID=A0A5C3L380_COPMA|nr:hypothetical protein FA15DRAFT_701862 [Coprinopsis marcescibilis]